MPGTERLEAVDIPTAGALHDLWARAERADGVAAVSEAFALAVGPPRAGVVHLLSRDDVGGLIGYAQVAAAGTTDAVSELVVDPDARRRGVGRALLEAAVAAGTRSAWAHGDLAPARGLASVAELERTRSLHLMARPLTATDATDPVLPQGYSWRPFEPGLDDEHWVRLNAAAFAQHGEQGRLTLEDLHERMAQPWFDPAGFLLVERDGRVVAFHWTKVEPGDRSGAHRARGSSPGAAASGAGPGRGAGADERREGVGEVYVVGVDPAAQGHGLGGPLTRLGLAHLAREGLAEVRLYVDGDNTPARRTYERTGFSDLAVDAQYSVPAT